MQEMPQLDPANRHGRTFNSLLHTLPTWNVARDRGAKALRVGMYIKLQICTMKKGDENGMDHAIPLSLPLVLRSD
jgi:hypothetical protein